MTRRLTRAQAIEVYVNFVLEGDPSAEDLACYLRGEATPPYLLTNAQLADHVAYIFEETVRVE